MKRQVLSLAAVLATLLVSGSAYAQTMRIKANVPFDFVISGRTMPAGAYSIEAYSNDGKTLLLRSDAGKAKGMINTISAESLKASDRTKLVFHRYDNRYFLSQVWVAGNNRGKELPRSSRETEVAADFPVQNVVLTAEAQ